MKKLTKKPEKGIMTSAQQGKCHAIIHSASAAAGGIGGGLAQIIGADIIPLMGIQATMVISLGAVFGLSIKKSSGKAVVSSLGAGMIGKYLAQTLVGLIPVFGNAAKAAVAAGFTEMIGWTAANSFAKGFFAEDESAAEILKHILK